MSTFTYGMGLSCSEVKRVCHEKGCETWTDDRSAGCDGGFGGCRDDGSRDGVRGAGGFWDVCAHVGVHEADDGTA